MLAEDGDIVSGCDEGLVTATVFVVDVLADHFPRVDVEEVFFENLVGVLQAVQNEPFDPASEVVQIKWVTIQTGE